MDWVEDKCIVLKTYPYQERNLIVHVLSENHGRIQLTALNGAGSKRFAGGLGFLSASKFVWAKKAAAELGRLERLEPIRQFQGFSRDYEKFKGVSFVSEILLRLRHAEANPQDLFKLFSNYLIAVEEENTSADGVSAVLATSVATDEKFQNFMSTKAFLIKLLQWYGSTPQLKECESCHRAFHEFDASAEVRLSLEQCGWKCAECGSVGGRENFGGEFNKSDHKHEAPRIDRHFSTFTIEAIAQMLFCLNTPIRTCVSTPIHALKAENEWFAGVWQWVQFHIPGMDQPFKGLS